MTTVTRSAPIRRAPGAASAIADGQSWTVDTTAVNLNAAAFGTGLTFTYALTGAPAGVTINPSTGLITGTPTAAASGTAIATATDQYGRTYDDTFTFTSSFRTQATGGVDLDLAFAEDSAITPTNLVANWTTNGNTLTYAIVGTPLPTGLSVSTAGSMTGTPTTITSDATYTLRGTDEYGRTTDDTFTLEITAVASFTATIDAVDDVTDTITVTVSHAGTLYWRRQATDTNPAAATIVAGGGLDAGSFAVSAGTVNEDITFATGNDGLQQISITLDPTADPGNYSTPSHAAITIDTVDPAFPTLSPIDGAADVAVDANLVMTFNEAMIQTGTVTLKVDGGADIETFDLSAGGAAVWSVGNTVLTINPTADFTNAASLAVRWSGLQDEAGNPLTDNATDTLWNFGVVAGVPAAFVDADWSVATGSGANELDVTIAALPANNGSAITDVQYDIDANNTWASLPAYAGIGPYTISMAAPSTSYAIRLRAVNAIGNSAAGNSESATSGAAASGIQYVGGKLVNPTTGTGDATISLTGLSGGLASAPAENDIVVLHYAVTSNTSRTGAMVIGGAEGWTAITSAFVNDAFDSNYVGAYKIMGVTPDTTVDVGGSASSGNSAVIGIQVWRGVDTTTPLDVAIQSAAGDPSKTADPPSITPITSGAVVLVHAQVGYDWTESPLTLGPTTGLDNALQGNDSASWATATLCGSINWTSGAVNPDAVSISGTVGGNTSYAICIALRPA